MKKITIMLFCAALFFMDSCTIILDDWDGSFTDLCHIIIINNSGQRIRTNLRYYHHRVYGDWLEPGDMRDIYAEVAIQYPSPLGISDTFFSALLGDSFYIYDENDNILVQWSSKDSSDFDISIFNPQNWQLTFKPEPQEYYEEYPTPVWEYVITDEIIQKGNNL